MSRDARIPTSVTQRGRVTVRIYDEEAYQANIRRYYGNDAATSAPSQSNQPTSVKFEKKKPSARYDWARWREPMIKGELA